MKPEPEIKPVVEKVKPRGTIVDKVRIIKLIQLLVKNLNMLFSMYSYPKKVGDLLKTVDGFN